MAEEDEWPDFGPDPDPPLCRHCGKPRGPANQEVEVSVGEFTYRCYKGHDECADCRRKIETRYILEREEKRRQDLAKEWRERSELGRRLEAARDSYQVTDANRSAKAQVDTWVEKPTCNCIIVGPIGCGKSFLMAHAFFRLQQDYAPAYWLSVPRLFEAIKAGYDGGGNAGLLIGWAKKAPVLFLDDLGKVHSQNVSWVEEQLYSIVDVRYCDELPTVVTTEYAGAALRQRVGESVITRLEHGAVVAGIKKPASSYRKVAG